MPAAVRAGALAAALAVAAALGGCGDDRGQTATPAGDGAATGPPQLSPSARPEVVAMLREDLAAPRHPADGGGRAWLVSTPGDEPVVAGGAGHWRIVYEAGPYGIAEGGMLVLQPSPFWGWSPPQAESPDWPGFTTATVEAAGVGLAAEAMAQGMLGFRVTGRDLAAEERIELVYGAGAPGARADRYAERESPLWLAVDGDGDGIRGLLTPPLTIEVAARPAARLVVTLPSAAAPGERVRLTVAAVDGVGNRAEDFRGAVGLAAEDGLDLPASVALGDAEAGAASVAATVRRAGVWRVTATAGALAGESNPLVVGDGGSPILWADLHGHSQLSDGTATPEDWFRYAREVAALDAVSLTDHDHWGMRPLARSPEAWERIRGAAEAAHEPGRFVSLLGYEWTSWIHGHRHVLYFGDEGEVHDSIDPRFDHPRELWAALRGRDALTIAHHSAGGPVATNWGVPPDPELEPVTEVVSVHGSSEAADSPLPIYAAVEGNWVRDALDRGYRLGLLGSGDGHDGHPGLAHLGAPSGGLAALLTDDLTREGVLAALRARRVYATSGPRIVLRASLAGRRMGEAIVAARLPTPARLVVQVVAVAPLASIDLVRSGRVVASEPASEREAFLEWSLPDLAAGEYVYVRAVQEDGHAAWSSPFFIE